MDWTSLTVKGSAVARRNLQGLHSTNHVSGNDVELDRLIDDFGQRLAVMTPRLGGQRRQQLALPGAALPRTDVRPSPSTERFPTGRFAIAHLQRVRATGATVTAEKANGSNRGSNALRIPPEPFGPLRTQMVSHQH